MEKGCGLLIDDAFGFLELKLFQRFELMAASPGSCTLSAMVMGRASVIPGLYRPGLNVEESTSAQLKMTDTDTRGAAS